MGTLTISPHRRIGFLFLSLLLLFGGAGARAELKGGDAIELVRDVDLRREASFRSSSLGKLPRGTIATFQGGEANGYLEVEVELENGSISGWIPRTAVSAAARGEEPEGRSRSKPEKYQVEEPSDEPREIRPRSKLTIPKDEGLLLRRDSSFFYGLLAGGNFSVMNDTNTSYTGLGFTGGAFGGVFLAGNVPLQLEVSYSLANGTGADGSVLSFGFLDTVATLGYEIEGVELFAGGQYSVGLSIGSLPATIAADGPANFSNAYGVGGAGYHFALTDTTSLGVRGRYAISFLQTPVIFQFVSLLAYLQFSG